MNGGVIGVAAVLGSGVFAGACSNPVDTSENKLPYLSADATDAAGDATDADGPTCDCLAPGMWFRFDSLALTSIDHKNHPVIATLNGLWASDIAGNELNIMLEITDVSATEVKAHVLNGARVDGTQTICAIASTQVDLTFPRSGCALEQSNESGFNVYAGTETYPKNCSTTLPVKHAIPVSRAQLEGHVNDDCSAILEGHVPSGGLGQAQLNQTCTCLLLPGKPAENCEPLDPSYDDVPECVGCNENYRPLSQLLTAFGEVDWLCTTEDGGPAACLTADFTAVAMAGAPEPCANRQ